VREAGFSLHAATRAGAADEQGREALLKYAQTRGKEEWPRQRALQGRDLFALRGALARLQSQRSRTPPNAHSAAL